MINKGIISAVIVAGIAFIIVGLAMNFAPTMMTGFEAARNSNNASLYTGFTTTITLGPTLIILGFIIMVGVVGFMQIKLAGK